MSKPNYAFTKPRQEEFLQHLREGMRRGAASDIVFGSDNPNQRRRTRDYIAANPAFELAVIDAETEATEHVEEALYQAAISGSVPAAKAWIDLKGGGQAKQVGRPAKEAEDASGQAADDLFNVTPIDPRQRRKNAQARGEQD